MAADDEAHKGGGTRGEGVAHAPSVHNDVDDDVQQQPFFLPIFLGKKQQILTSFCVYKNAIALTSSRTYPFCSVSFHFS